jgi:integrase
VLRYPILDNRLASILLGCRPFPNARATAHGWHRVPPGFEGPEETQMFMRHKSITTTADTYMHLDREDLEEAMRFADLRWQDLKEAG